MMPIVLVPVFVIGLAVVFYGVIAALITAANRRAEQGKDIRD